MDDATQKLAQEAWDAREATLFHDAPDEAKAFIAADRAGFLAGFEAAQRPPVAEPDNHHNADVCPFCTQMLDAIQRLEAAYSKGADHDPR